MSKILSTKYTISKKSSAIKSEIQSLILVGALALLFRIFVIELFFVPTGSMKATILEGDYIFATKYSYGFSNHSLPFSPDLFSGRIFASLPEAGDIIIMRPPHDMDIRYVKRLIALPGEKIQIIDNVTYINDRPVERIEVGDYTDEKNRKYLKFKETLPNGASYFSYKLKQPDEEGHNVSHDNLNHHNLNHHNIKQSNFGPYTVPENSFFFMGDNRDESGDSRYQLGAVPFENLIAKAQLILFSTKEFFWQEDLNLWQQLARIPLWLSSIRFKRSCTYIYNLED